MSDPEREPLLSETNPDITSYDNEAHSAQRIAKKNPNEVSGAKLYWILGASWVTVFLGAMDGTIVATLQQPIGDYFEKSYQASYIGTSYLLSVCCFTPLYGT